MKKILFLAFLSPLFLSAQSDTIFIRRNQASHDEPIHYATDTIIFGYPETPVLAGTTMLPNSAGGMQVYGFGIYFSGLSGSDCSSHGEHVEDPEEVLSTELVDSQLIINCRIVANCCHYFLGDVSIEEDSILNLVYYGYGSGYCACACCFGLTYTFGVLDDEWDRENFQKMKYIMINGDRKTLREVKLN